MKRMLSLIASGSNTFFQSGAKISFLARSTARFAASDIRTPGSWSNRIASSTFRSEDEIVRDLLGHAAAHRLVRRLANNGQTGRANGFRQHWLEDRHLIDRRPVRTHDWRVHPLRHILGEVEVRVRPAQHRADDGLLGLDRKSVV